MTHDSSQSNPQALESLGKLLDLLFELKETQSNRGAKVEAKIKQPKLDRDGVFNPNLSTLKTHQKKIVDFERYPPQKTNLEQNKFPSLSFPSSSSQQSKKLINPISRRANTNNPNSSKEREIQQSIVRLEQQLINHQYEVKEVVDSVNSLIPLISELLRLQLKNSQESVSEALVPIIDRVIKQRYHSDPQSMAEAIAQVLPNAIAQEIKIAPQAIAKAIAPEVALSISEQILLDENSISQALGSEMGKAIKTQIELEKDAMVDALYPVIGNTISKYMVEVIKSINEKVETALSIDGIKRKIRAKLRGVSEAELILSESVGCQVKAIFLIHKASGLIIREIQPNPDSRLESDLLAGMLTAIRSFANDCMVSNSELDQIDYGDSQIALEVAGYCYLAIVIKGDPSKQYRAKIRHTLSLIVLKYGHQIREYNGDPTDFPDDLNILLQQLLEANERAEKSKSPTTLMWLLAILLGSTLISWGIIQYRSHVAERLEQETLVALDSAPELSVYRLIPQIAKGKLTLVGRVPNDELRTQAGAIGAKIASRANLQLNNQIIAINLPPDPTLTAQEVQRVTTLLNQQTDVAIQSNYQAETVTIAGFVLEEPAFELIESAFGQIPGVDTVIINVNRQLPTVDTRIYFDLGKTELKSLDNYSKIRDIKDFLKQYPQLNLRLTGYSDRAGSRSNNQQLSKERANNIKAALVAQGVDSKRLQVTSSLEYPPNVTKNDPAWLSRCVRFEPFIPQKVEVTSP
jgi:outer membrane protein OmpA-like peptidoglycan-associated protein